MRTDELQRVLAYHERSKHAPGRYAASLGYLDWASQPNPFRLHAGAELVPLARADLGPDGPTWPALFAPRPPAALDAALVDSLFFHSLALSAWKQHDRARWSLRVNPSSGNLHPTEAHLLAGPLPGLSDAPALYHYAPLLHALERRRVLPDRDWRDLVADLPEPCLLVGLSSIPWREAWKYGERAFRYCNHDVGHAIAAIAVAAALHGWRARLLDAPDDAALAALLGLTGRDAGPEGEHPDCLIALVPGDSRLDPARLRAWRPAPDLLARLADLPLAGEPNRLGEDHHPWPVLDEVRDATRRAAGDPEPDDPPPADPLGPARGRDAPPVPAGPLVRARRSAVAMDGRTGLSAPAFYDMLLRTLPGGLPFDALAWPPAVDLALLVHRVEGLGPGLYLLLRDPAREPAWRAAADPGFAWEPPPGCPDLLPLRLLARGDARRSAAFLSCGQDIAADGAFTLGMLAEFTPALARGGPAHYRRLFWETGAIGQVLYLEAEALGIAGTGIGCFFDDVVHDLLGLRDRAFQSLYHFTVGGRVDDPRLRTLDPYHHLDARDA